LRNDLWGDVREGERRTIKRVGQNEKMNRESFVVKGNDKKEDGKVRVRKS
jgi:hypothetical protein